TKARAVRRGDAAGRGCGLQAGVPSTLSPSARKEHDRLLTVFSIDFSKYRVDQITPVDIRRSIRNLYTGKHSVAKHYKSRISRFFRWAVEEAGLRSAP